MSLDLKLIAIGKQGIIIFSIASTTLLYGIRSLSYFGPIVWNMLPNSAKDANSLSIFKNQISEISFSVALLCMSETTL